MTQRAGPDVAEEDCGPLLGREQRSSPQVGGCVMQPLNCGDLCRGGGIRTHGLFVPNGSPLGGALSHAASAQLRRGTHVTAAEPMQPSTAQSVACSLHGGGAYHHGCVAEVKHPAWVHTGVAAGQGATWTAGTIPRAPYELPLSASRKLRSGRGGRPRSMRTALTKRRSNAHNLSKSSGGRLRASSWLRFAAKLRA